MEKIITLKKDEKYLTDYSGDIWDFKNGLPSGLINKKYTGVGATYTEILTTSRNSIIVSPTVSLAKSKSEEWIEKNIHNCFYVGGGVSNIDIKEFLKNASPSKKIKFFVVADSFPRLIKILGTKAYDDYFLLIDEIDTFQTDTSYRSSLEYVIDYFHDFTDKAAVTATLIPFSDEKFSPINIDYYVIEKEDYVKTDLNLISSDNELETACNVVITLLEKGEKVVVALNSIKKGINKLCKTLTENSILKAGEIGVMCSEQSKIDLYKGVNFCIIESNDNNEFILKHQLTFITSSYFVGVDFHDKFHLVIVNCTSPIHAALPFEKIVQITGRGRNGLLSNNVVSFNRFQGPFYSFKKEPSLKIISSLKKAYDLSKRELSDYPEQWELFKKQFLEQTIEEEKGFIRLNFKDEVVPSYFTIDYKSHFFETLMSYRKGLNKLENNLSKYYNVLKNNYKPIHTYELESYTSQDFVDAFHSRFPDLYENILSRIPEEEKEWGSVQNIYFFNLAERYKKVKKNYAAILQLMFFIEKYGKLEKALAEFLVYNGKRLKIIEFKRLLLLYKLRNSNEYNSFSKYFEVNKEYTLDEYRNGILDLLKENKGINDYFDKSALSEDKNLFSLLSQLFNIKKRRSTKYIPGKKVTVYVIEQFKSIDLDNSKPSTKHNKLEDFAGVSLKSYLLNLSKSDLEILGK